jgi:hypothetical protein
MRSFIEIEIEMVRSSLGVFSVGSGRVETLRAIFKVSAGVLVATSDVSVGTHFGRGFELGSTRLRVRGSLGSRPFFVRVLAGRGVGWSFARCADSVSVPRTPSAGEFSARSFAWKIT